MYSSLLVIGLLYEISKAKLTLDNINDRVNEWIETHVPDERDMTRCDGTLICQHEGWHHKRNCIGKDLPFDQYAEALINA